MSTSERVSGFSSMGLESFAKEGAVGLDEPLQAVNPKKAWVSGVLQPVTAKCVSEQNVS